MHWNILLHVESFMYYFPRDSHICPKNLVLYRSLSIMFSLGVQIAMFKVSALQPPSPLPLVMCTIVLILKIHKKKSLVLLYIITNIKSGRKLLV